MRLLASTVALSSVLVLAGCSSGGGSGATTTVTTTVTETATPTPTVADTPAALPRPVDFKIKLKIRKKDCFGSAGCNISYQIAPTYVGSEDISTGSYSVTYEVDGGDSGPQVNTFTQDSGSASYDQEETISTASTTTVLKAKVTAVDTN